MKAAIKREPDGRAEDGDGNTRAWWWMWAHDDLGKIKRVKAYECPSNDMLYVPDLGYSGSLGHLVFETEKAARAKAIKEAEEQLEEAALILRKLRKDTI